MARSRGWRIAIVTNGERTQENKIHHSGLSALVDAWCVSAIEGCAKPDPQLLSIAVNRCGEQLKNAWLIGDGPETDIAAAVRAAVPCVWLRRGRAWLRKDFRPTYQADTFAEAVQFVVG